MAEKTGTLARNMVIALTGNARQGQIEQALQAGMDDGESSLVYLHLHLVPPRGVSLELRWRWLVSLPFLFPPFTGMS